MTTKTIKRFLSKRFTSRDMIELQNDVMDLVVEAEALRKTGGSKPDSRAIITTEKHHAAQKAVLRASEAGEMFEDEPFNIVNAIIKTWGLEQP